MTDIFARKPQPLKPGHNLPSLRYELFIKKIELEVVAAQSRIKALEAMEQVYNLVREALEACRFPNDTSLNLTTCGVSVEIKAIPTDRLAGFDALTRQIGERLLREGLHRDGEPSIGCAGYQPVRKYTWMLATKEYRLVDVSIDIPEQGLSDCRVIKQPRTYTVDEYRLEPAHGRPAPAVAPEVVF